MFELHYTGMGYPSIQEIENDAKKRGFTYSYFASEIGYEALYNGDTVVVYTTTDGMNDSMKADVKKHGKKIQ